MSAPDSSPIVGIDLGTTNSVVAALVDGQVQVLDEDGEKILPSVVGLDPEGKLITGVVARNQQIAFPDRTVVSVKRHMGSMEPLHVGDQSFTPPEISAMILRRLRDRASRALGVPVSRAVITVPAFFDENQRQATREAGELAGLTVERIINEPTAATLVYHAGSQDQRNLVVYDFGGGTFDVSIVRMEAGVAEVLSSKGDTRLGGDDLDQVLMNHVADHFQDEHGVDLRQDVSARWRLLQACELAKRRLSSEETVRISEEFIAEKEGQPLNVDVAVSRSQYEELIAGFVDRTIDCVDQALRDAKMTTDQIHDLVLVGGTTRTPLVERRLSEEFGLLPSRTVDPDLAVALGAAIQGAMLAGVSVGPVLVDVTGHTLGIEVMSGFGLSGPQMEFAPIIHRNTPLPAVHEEPYQTVTADQERAKIHVLQGEHREVSRNQSIGELMLDLDAREGESDAVGGGRKIVVRFELTLDGTLKVTATQAATGKSKELTVNNALSQFREEDRERAAVRLDALFDQSDELLGEEGLPGPGRWSQRVFPGNTQPRPGTAPSAAAPPAASQPAEGGTESPAAALLTRARQVAPTVEGEDAEEIAELVEQLESAVSAGDQAKVDELCDELDDVLFYVQ